MESCDRMPAWMRILLCAENCGAVRIASDAKIIPKREWVENVVEAAQITGMKVFMKESLRGLMGEDFRQEFPWEVSADDA